MADKETFELMEQAISQVCEKQQKELASNNVNVKNARVISYDGESGIATVSIIDDTYDNEYKLYNKSGETLDEGDSVKIYYTTNIAKGWIGMRVGVPNYPKVESSGTEIVITSDQSKHMLNDYEIIRVVDGDTHCYGAAGNNIIVSGMEIPMYHSFNSFDDAHMYPENLYRFDLSGLWGNSSTTIMQHEIFFYCTKIHKNSSSSETTVLTYNPVVDNVLKDDSNISSWENHVIGFLPCYTDIHPIYDGENYGYVEIKLMYKRTWTDGRECIASLNGVSSEDYGTLSYIGFASAEERDAAMAVINFAGSAE